MPSPARSLRACLRTGLALLLLGTAAWARPQGEKRTLPDFDKRTATAPAAASPDKSAAAGQLRARLREARVETDAVSEAPKFVGSPREFLTGPGGEGRAVPKARLQARAAREPHREAKAFLEEYKGLYGHGAEVLTAAQVKRDYTNQHNGLRSVVWQQQVDGVPVFGALLQAHTTKRGELVNVASTFQPDPAAAANRGTPRRAARLAAPAISAVEAVAIAARNIGEAVQAADLAGTAAPVGAEKKQSFRAAALRGATVHFVWLPMDKGSSRLCWEVVLTGQTTGEMFRLLIDATTGEAQVRNCLTNYISEASYRVFTGDSPTPFQPGHATPSTAQPAEVPRTLVTLSALDTTASPNGWIDDGVTETRGNNVDAHLDLDNNNVADTPRPQGSGLNSRVFDFPLDLAQAPSTYRDASVTQLFYWCNWMHDKLYQLGFNEASGNFQLNNFGRGGAGNDAVQADAQDGGGTDNANFSTPPDGSAGRMQMYVFSGPNPDRDGSLDAPIVLHEYTHGLSNRLVGGGAGISTLAAQGMGEGWSDFYSLALLTKEADDVNGNYVEGGYATLGFGGLTQNYYYGIRRYPYTTDMAKNPLTFRDIDPTQASLHSGIPRSPVIGTSASAVHNSGEVWCVALWEARANLIAKHGFAVGNQLILQLVTDGMKLSPSNPNFIQARDAIIQADLVNNAGANRNELWAAFAKRGMGASATAPSSSTTTGVVESFDLPDDLGVTPASAFTASGPVGGPFSPTATTYTLRNNGTAALNWTATKSAAWLTLSPASGALNPGATTTVTVSLNAAANSLPAAILSDTVLFTNTGSGRTLPRTVNFYVGQPDYFTELFDTTNNDTANQSFTFTPSASPDAYTVVREPVTAFPSDMTTGTTTITMTDDSFSAVALTGGASVRLYGTTYTTFFVGSNGYITFGSGDTQWTESFANHFAKPRIAGLFRDLNPPVLGGNVKRRQFTDRVAVAWQSVREYGTALANNFMIEMFFDGRIRITARSIASTKGLIGLSRGTGVPAGFTQSNFSGYPLPTLGVTLPASATEGAGALANQGSVTLSSPTAVARTITLTSSDPTAVTVPATVTLPADQSSVTFTPTILDDTKINGTRAVTITASATGLTAATRACDVLDDENTNLALTLPDLNEGGSATGTATISGTLTANLVVAFSSANPARLSVPASATIPAGATSATFTATGVNNTLADGTASVLVTASAAGFTAASRTVSVEDDDAHHFVIAPIIGAKIRGAPFNVTISAVTVNGLPVPTYSGTVYLNTLTGVPLTPPTLTLTGGTVTAAISAGAFGNGVILRATDANWRTGASNAFDVTFGPLDHFAWDAVGAQTIGVPFPVRVTALDVAGNTVADYTGTAALDCGTPGNRTVPLSPATTGNFVAGGWSGVVAAGQIIDGVTLGAADGAATGESGTFNVLGIPVLGVTPADSWSTAGNFAGPFVPPSRTYTLTNSGTGILAWSVSTPADWLTFSATSGTLAAGASTTVTATIAAPNTDPGTHAADITLANTANGLGTATRGVVLTVNLPPPALAWLPAFSGGTATTLAWGPVAGAQWFEAQYSADLGFTSPTSSGFIAATSHTFTGLGDGRHYYRVRSRRVHGAAVFDSVWSPLQTSHQAASGPAVIVTTPTLTTQPALTVQGLAFDAAGIASLTVNGTAATSPDGFAHWTATGVGLAPGSNTLTILTTSTAFAPATTTTNWNVYLATLTTDFDHDGLPDLWEIQNGLGYDSATGTSGPLGDLSGNGVSNLLKYALNLDPLSPALTGLPVTSIEVNPADSARYLTFRYRRLLAPGPLQYKIETTSDLLDWTTTAADFEELAPAVPNADGLTETVTIRVKPAIDTPGTPTRSVRLRVLAP